jgi:hypothetical protein
MSNQGFVDVLEKVDSHPANRVAELTPRVWAENQKIKFIDNSITT